MPVRRRFVRHLAGLLIASGVAAGTGGCASSSAPESGVTRIDEAVVVAYKPCPGDRSAIERLALRAEGAAGDAAPVWRAQRRPGGIAVLDMPIRSRYPGYAITDRRAGRRLDRATRYTFVATGTDGADWGGPTFSLGDLDQGLVAVGGGTVEFRDWVDSPTSCARSLGDRGLALGALVLAGAVGLGLLARWYRGRPERTPPHRV